jgi:O-glycosyl hydrolase
LKPDYFLLIGQPLKKNVRLTKNMKRSGIKRKKRTGAAALLLASLLACGAFVGVSPRARTARAAGYITVDPTARFQTFDGWGTSLCWWANAVGGWTMTGASGREKREEVAEAVFGAGGLNMNIARYNIPGGDDPAHSHMRDYRGMPLIRESADGGYNFGADARQIWVLNRANELRAEAAAQNGVPSSDMVTEAFSNSPPYWMTVSGCSSGAVKTPEQIAANNAVVENLAVSEIPAFAEYLADAIEHLISEGIPVHYAEPVNEPSSGYWRANGRQEGCDVSVANLPRYYDALYAELQKRGLSNVQLAGPDETSMSKSVSAYNSFGAATKNKLAKINTHSYGAGDGDRAALKNLAYGSAPDYGAQNKKLWMSEICLSSDTDAHDGMSESLTNDGRNLADDIRRDLYTMGANAWIVWQAVESELSNMGGLNYGLIHGVYQDNPNAEYGLDMDARALNKGDYFLTKQYYTVGQYSRYIKAGYRIIGISGAGDGARHADGSVAAVSPEGDTVVIVTPNREGSSEPIHYYIKNFEAEGGYTVVTDAERNWETAELPDANGSYARVDLAPRSVTTTVLRGAFKPEKTADSPVYLKSFTAGRNGLFAEYSLPSAAGSYKLYYASDAERLPVNGGGAPYIQLAAKAGEAAVSAPASMDGANFFAVIEYVNGNKITYSRVMKRAASDRGVTDDFVYATSGGRLSKGDYGGTPLSFGRNYGLADQAFGADPFTGRKWGYLETGVGEYAGDDPLASCRYSDTPTLTYKYEVEGGAAAHRVLMTFLDPWGAGGRAMSLWVNGEDCGLSVGDTSAFAYLYTEGVKGVYDARDGRYYITLQLRALSDKNPAVNLITVQRGDQPVLPVGAVSSDGAVEWGKPISDGLPKTARAVTTAGAVEYAGADVRWLPYDYSKAQQPNTTSTVTGEIVPLKLKFTASVTTFNAAEQVYYYVNATHASDPVNSAALAEFNGVKAANGGTMLNERPDRHYRAQNGAKPDGGWGLVHNGASFDADYGYYWMNEASKWQGVVEGKAAQDGTPKTIRYWLPGLTPDETYTFEVGMLDHWAAYGAGRSFNFRNGASPSGNVAAYTENGVQRAGADVPGYGNGNATYVFEMTADASGAIDFRVVGTGTENPCLSWFTVKKTTEQANGAKPDKPSLPAVVSGGAAQVTVGNLTEGAVLALTGDTAGKEKSLLLAERLVTAADAAAGSVTFTGLDLSNIAVLYARQYNGRAAGDAASADVPRLAHSAPRSYWDGRDDVITVDASSGVGVEGLFVRDGADGAWADIKAYKYFRAAHNGVYYLKLVTKSKFEVVKEIEITHVDRVSIRLDNDLSAWTNQNLTLKIDASDCSAGVRKIEVTDAGKTYDITRSYGGGRYLYTVTGNRAVSVRVTTEAGASGVFEYDITNIDKAAPALSAEYRNERGALRAFLTADAPLSALTLSVIHKGAETEVLDGDYILSGDGEYIFRAVNAAGGETLKTARLYTGFENAPASMSMSEETSGGGAWLSFAFRWDTASAKLVRADGAGGVLALANGRARVTENGRYQLMTVNEKGETEIVSFTVSVFAGSAGGAAEEQSRPGAAAAVSAGAVFAAGGAALTVLFFARRKKA